MKKWKVKTVGKYTTKESKMYLVRRRRTKEMFFAMWTPSWASVYGVWSVMDIKMHHGTLQYKGFSSNMTCQYGDRFIELSFLHNGSVANARV